MRAPNERTWGGKEGQRSAPCQERRCGGEEEGMNEGLEEEGCDVKPWGRRRQEEVGEKCSLAGPIRRQAQMRRPKADS